MRAWKRLARLVSLVLFALFGASALMYSAPGYFADAREMDATRGTAARSDLDRMRAQQDSLHHVLWEQTAGWLHGDLGMSRQYQVPVRELLRERGWKSAKVLLTGVLAGWLAALFFAVPLSLSRSRRSDFALALTTAPLLALPVGAMATFCLLGNLSEPALVLAVVVAVRDTKLLHRVLQQAWRAPHIVHARAQGFSSARILTVHIFPILRSELLSIGMMSFTLALSALVPVEVVFDLPGLGQLAWSAAMNRDLPVLVAVTCLMAGCFGIAGFLVEPERPRQEVPCA